MGVCLFGQKNSYAQLLQERTGSKARTYLERRCRLPQLRWLQLQRLMKKLTEDKDYLQTKVTATISKKLKNVYGFC